MHLQMGCQVGGGTICRVLGPIFKPIGGSFRCTFRGCPSGGSSSNTQTLREKSWTGVPVSCTRSIRCASRWTVHSLHILGSQPGGCPKQQLKRAVRVGRRLNGACPTKTYSRGQGSPTQRAGCTQVRFGVTHLGSTTLLRPSTQKLTK